MRRSAILLSNPLKPTAHSGLGVGEYSAMHFMGALFPVSAGIMLYGWRAAWAVALVVLAALFPDELTPRCALQRDRIFAGDVLNCAPSHPDGPGSEPWVRRPVVRGFDAVGAPSVPERLIAYTRGVERPEHGLLRIQG